MFMGEEPRPMSATSTQTRELKVEGTPTITVRNMAGSVSIVAGGSSQVTVVITKKTRGLLGGGESDLERVQVEVTQQGDAITIATHYPGSFGAHGITVDLDITTPATTNLNLRHAAGNVRVQGIAGTFTSTVNAGNFDASGVTLSASGELELNAGNLTLDGALAPGASLDVRINAGNAELTLPRETPAYLDARTTVGVIRVSGWEVKTTRNVVQQHASGPLGPDTAGGTLTVTVDAGNIRLNAR
jgi:hypothetical protein